MKKTMKKVLAMLLAVVLVAGVALPTVPAEAATGDTIILYTNDVHCAIDYYDEFAAYYANLEDQGYNVIVVDAGDAIQGEVIGTMTKGQAIVDIMNYIYDYAVPGNHEFDYQMEAFEECVELANYEYICANFAYLGGERVTSVFQPYALVEANGVTIGLVGITTPETYTKSTPKYFQDENGEFIYSFCEDDLSGVVQSAVDNARTNGADIVVAVGHLGIEGTTDGWKSTDVIAETTGIDYFIDAHSHEVIEANEYDNADGEAVPLTSTGTKFAYFGQLTIAADGTMTSELIDPRTIDVTQYSTEIQEYAGYIADVIDGYNTEVDEYYGAVVGESEVSLTINDAEGNRAVRNSETNMGDFVADAYRAITGAEIGIANGGGVRASIAAGNVTREMLASVNPWSNEMCVIKLTGQQILDALEHSARNYPEENGGFLQVSGMTYDIHAWVESPVVLDAQGAFDYITEGAERRIANVKVNGVAIDPTKTYTVAGSCYTLMLEGDGYTMFAGAEPVVSVGLPVDNEMLMQYFSETLDGVVTEEQYGNPEGDGRIKIYETEADLPDDDEDGKKDDDKKDDDKKEDGKSPDTGEVVYLPAAVFVSIIGLAFVIRKRDSLN